MQKLFIHLKTTGSNKKENYLIGNLLEFYFFRNMNANTMQFLQEFKRYQELMRRPSIQVYLHHCMPCTKSHLFTIKKNIYTP